MQPRCSRLSSRRRLITSQHQDEESPDEVGWITSLRHWHPLSAWAEISLAYWHAGGKGYSFATWLRLEDVDAQAGTAGRALYTLLLRSPDGPTKGVTAAFKGGPAFSPGPGLHSCSKSQH